MGGTETVPARPGAAKLDAPATHAPGDLIADRYEVVRFLARGGMGEVYEVRDRTLDLRVALKTMRPELARDEAVVRRFRREVELARRVTHEHVCRIFDAGSDGGAPFLTMELIGGETLAERLARDGRLDVAAADPIVRAIAAGLAAAHRAGVVHRDLKPGNVMLDGARVVVTDFGLAHRDVSDDGATALTGAAIVGTPGYMAPEQVLGEPTGTPTDIYALGVLVYELVTGELPFRGETPMATAALRLKTDPRPPRALVPTLPEAWQRAILGCLAREPAARLAGVDQVLATLDGARPRRRWPIAAGLGAIALAGVAVAVIATRTTTTPPRPTAPGLLRQTPLALGASGKFFQTALSPDGRRVALADGTLRVVDAAGGTPRTLAVPDDAIVQYVSWYRDSSRLLVSWSRGDTSELVELSADGGTARVVTDGVQGRVSPDGQHLALLRGTDVVVTRLDGGEARVVATFTDTVYEWIAWSQDGRALAIFDGKGVRVVSADGARTIDVAPPGSSSPMPEAGLTWLSGGRLVVVAIEPPSFDQHLWATPIDTTALRVTGAAVALGAFPLQNVTAIDSGDGARLSLVLRSSTTDVMAMAIPGPADPLGVPRPLTDRVTAEAAYAFSDDGSNVLVADGGAVQRVPRGGGPLTRLFDGPHGELWPLDDATALEVRTEDGRLVVVELALADGAERARVTLADTGDARTRVQCARVDPRRCVLGREAPAATTIRAFDRATGGGAAIATVTGGGTWALSPDGATVAVLAPGDALQLVTLASGAATTRPLPCRPQSVTWLDAARPIVGCMTDQPPRYELRVVEPDGATRAIYASADHWVAYPVVSPDATWIAFSSLDLSSRAFVVDWAP